MPRIGICVKNLTSGGAEKQAVLLANTLVPEHSVAFIIVNGEKVHEKYLNHSSTESMDVMPLVYSVACWALL